MYIVHQRYLSNCAHHVYHANKRHAAYGSCVCDIYVYGNSDSCCVMAGLYAKGTPKGGYPSHLMTGAPKAASVHEMDMTPSQPGPGAGAGSGAGATKRRNRAARNPTSAPGLQAQNWGDAGMPFMPGMFHSESPPHACQLTKAVIQTLDAWCMCEALCGDMWRLSY